jgi:hypothetical protein
MRFSSRLLRGVTVITYRGERKTAIGARKREGMGLSGWGRLAGRKTQKPLTPTLSPQAGRGEIRKIRD